MILASSGSPGERLGGLLGHLGAILGVLEGILGRLGGILEPSYPSWRPSWPYWRHLGGHLGQSWPSWRPSRAILEDFLWSLRSFGDLPGGRRDRPKPQDEFFWKRTKAKNLQSFSTPGTPVASQHPGPAKRRRGTNMEEDNNDDIA